MKNKKIPLKNYVIVAIITIITLCLTFVFANSYKRQKLYENEQNAVMSFLSEVKDEELDNFIIENHDVMIYVANSKHDNDKIQKKVKKIINRNNYTRDIVYLNSKNLSEDFYTSFFEKYGNRQITNIKSDSLVMIKDKQIIKIINITEENISSLEKIIESNFYGD